MMQLPLIIAGIEGVGCFRQSVGDPTFSSSDPVDRTPDRQ